MPDRTTTLASTVIATVLAGTGLMSAMCAPARAAEDCLREPKHEASAGGHWYYRVDRQNHRKCWYLADEGYKTDQHPSAKPLRSARKNSEPAAERIPQANADARAELPALRYSEPPDQPNVSEKPDVEAFTEGPPRSAPEDPVPPPGNVLLNSARPGEGEPATASAVEDALADAAPEALPTVASREPAAQLPADETPIGPFRLTVSLLLMGMGLAAVTAAVVFRRSGAVAARRNDAPFPMQDAAAEPEESFEERASLALSRDVPLFLVHGQPGPDQWA
jgi:hypothetical protein